MDVEVLLYSFTPLPLQERTFRAQNMYMVSLTQDKQQEKKFFDDHAVEAAYDVFTPQSNERLINAIVRLGAFGRGSRVADLGCGSGVFTDLLQQRGIHAVGLDISPKMTEIGRRSFPNVEFLEGDVESLPFDSASFDGVLLSGIVHHLPDLKRCAAEVFRVLRPGGRFVAFDPNRMNPFMWLYRDRSSPFYSSVGVTENERPILANAVAEVFCAAGFRVNTEYLSKLSYRYIASSRVRWLLPIYNAIDGALFGPNFMRPFRSFVLTIGEKP
jgi:ubiquinone/menaquinone biosynthesis C-methylase UbiE